jgi:hypothetical protein
MPALGLAMRRLDILPQTGWQSPWAAVSCSPCSSSTLLTTPPPLASVPAAGPFDDIVKVPRGVGDGTMVDGRVWRIYHNSTGQPSAIVAMALGECWCVRSALLSFVAAAPCSSICAVACCGRIGPCQLQPQLHACHLTNLPQQVIRCNLWCGRCCVPMSSAPSACTCWLMLSSPAAVY